MAGRFTSFLSKVGNATSPFGFAPQFVAPSQEVDPAPKAGAAMLKNFGFGTLANLDRGLLPAIGAGWMGAQEMQNRNTLGAQEQALMMEQANAKRMEQEKQSNLEGKWGEWVSKNSDKFGEYADIAPYLDPQEGMQLLSGMQPDWRPASPEEKASLGLDPGTPLIMTANGPKVLGGGNTNVTVNNAGEIPDKKLREGLDTEQAKVWGEYLRAGAVSGSNAQDFAVLDELVKVAPQGPVTGRAAQMLPGISSAGAAFQSVVKRIAPTLRAPGSGSTSDIEYQGMLDSLPALSNKPEANQMILEIMKAKADLNVQRAEIITAYQAGEIDAQTARRAVAELDRESILTPEMKNALSGISGGSGGGWDDSDYTIEQIED